MRGSRILLVSLAVLAVGACTGLVGWGMRSLRGFQEAEWPLITNSLALRREATMLCHDAGGWRELQPSEYPPAMTALHPASISVSGERVYVALVPGGGGHHRFHGYSIWPDTVDRAGKGIERDESDGEPSG